MNAEETSTSDEIKVHFTYKEKPDMEALCQGDLLQITDGIKDILQDVHPYFLNEQYKYFMVLTQSCDLVRRDGSKCKTPYITLAAVKSFDEFFEEQLRKEKYAEEINGVLLVNDKKSERVRQFLERIYNNTEPDYFFLYKEPSLQLSESMIAILKVSITLKSKEHYDQCLSAKLLELSDEFKAKLGWLVGNIYSRVGTTDWESILSKDQRAELLKNELQNHCIIAPKETIAAIKDKIKQNADELQTGEAMLDFISGFQIDSKYDTAIKTLREIIESWSETVSAEEKGKLLNAIKSKQTFKMLF